jgi:hypothetical protein
MKRFKKIATRDGSTLSAFPHGLQMFDSVHTCLILYNFDEVPVCYMRPIEKKVKTGGY